MSLTQPGGAGSNEGASANQQTYLAALAGGHTGRSGAGGGSGGCEEGNEAMVVIDLDAHNAGYGGGTRDVANTRHPPEQQDRVSVGDVLPPSPSAPLQPLPPPPCWERLSETERRDYWMRCVRLGLPAFVADTDIAVAVCRL